MISWGFFLLLLSFFKKSFSALHKIPYMKRCSESPEHFSNANEWAFAHRFQALWLHCLSALPRQWSFVMCWGRLFMNSNPTSRNVHHHLLSSNRCSDRVERPLVHRAGLRDVGVSPVPGVIMTKHVRLGFFSIFLARLFCFVSILAL